MTLGSVTADSISSPRRLARDRKPTTWRADIDGLRTLAIALVVVYHVWFGRVSGGVDVFLLVSAFLLTASFLRAADTVGWGHTGRFWVRRFARLLPAAAVTIGGVLAFTLVMRPASAWRETWEQSWASLFYVQNWQLASTSVDYYARRETFPSPLQHFWSLSVQGQVFVIWPLLILAAIALARRWAADPRLVLAVTFGVVFVASFTWSLIATATQQQVAYFDTGARLWEFALGSLAALAIPLLRVPKPLAALLAWAGVIGLVTCGFVLDVGAAFPGVPALWPTLSAVCLLVAGVSVAKTLPTRFLSSVPMVRLGRIAYALYLVHWPVLIAYMVLRDRTEVGLPGGVVIIAVSLVLAWLLHRYVERPAGTWARTGKRQATVIVGSVLVVAVPLGGWQFADQVRASMASPELNPGAAVLLPFSAATAVDDAPIVPSGAQLDDEWIGLDDKCSGRYLPNAGALRESCDVRLAGSESPVALIIGDSHAQQWLGAVSPITDEAGWNLVAVMRAGCGYGAPDRDEDCLAWQEQATQYAIDLRPDVVVLMGSRAEADSAGEYVPQDLPRRVEQLAAAGSQILLVRDNPRFGYDMFACVERYGPQGDRCRVPRSEALAPEYPAEPLTAAESVHAADLSDYLCPEDVCESVIGNVAVYLDDNHLTGSYARSLSVPLKVELETIPSFPLP